VYGRLPLGRMSPLDYNDTVIATVNSSSVKGFAFVQVGSHRSPGGDAARPGPARPGVAEQELGLRRCFPLGGLPEQMLGSQNDGRKVPHVRRNAKAGIGWGFALLRLDVGGPQAASAASQTSVVAVSASVSQSCTIGTAFAIAFFALPIR